MEQEQTLHPLGAAARALGVPQGWLRAEADAGRIPHLRAGSRLLFNVDLLKRALLERVRRDAAVAGSEPTRRDR